MLTPLFINFNNDYPSTLSGQAFTENLHLQVLKTVW